VTLGPGRGPACDSASFAVQLIELYSDQWSKITALALEVSTMRAFLALLLFSTLVAAQQAPTPDVAAPDHRGA